MRLHVVCPSETIRYRDHIGWNSSKIISPPNSDKIVMWRFLRNRRLILRLGLHTRIFRALIYWAHRAVPLRQRGFLSDHSHLITHVHSQFIWLYTDVISFIVSLYLIIRYSRTLSLKAHSTCSRQAYPFDCALFWHLPTRINSRTFHHSLKTLIGVYFLFLV